MTNKELLRAIVAEIDLIMHDKDYRFPESENTWYSRESCKVLTPEEVFEELRTELRQLNNETNREIAELKKQLEKKEKTIQGLIEAQKYLERSCSYQMLLDTQKENILLKMQLKSQPAEIVEKIKGRFLATCQIEQGNDEMIASFQTFNRCLDAILKEYQK